jgi:signal transduction histidine kinase
VRQSLAGAVSNNANKKQAYFEVSAALFEELGERLVSKPEIALAELVKNSYDADATNCLLKLSANEIVVVDDGHGMTEDNFLKNWMVISSQAKGIARFSRKYGRSMAGSKGVGRFSARYLGSVVTLVTVADSDGAGNRVRLTAKFDWNKITTQGTIASVAIPYVVEEVALDVQTGTSLSISRLRKEATLISTATLKTDILRLTDPAAGLEKPPFKWTKRNSKEGKVDPGFSISFSDDDDDEDDETGANVQQEVLDAYVGRVRLTVDENGTLSYRVFWKDRDEPLEEKTLQVADMVRGFTVAALTPKKKAESDSRGLILAVQDIQHLPVAEELNSPIFIDLRFFPKRKGTFAGLSVNGKVAQSWLRDNASLAVIDNNFAMAAYASEDSDWLAIDASKAQNERSWQSIFTPALYPMGAAEKSDPSKNPMLALPRGTQIIGRVHIATRKRPPTAPDDSDNWLQPNMDRESLRSNGAFRLLWHIARFATELLAHFDRKVRIDEEAAAQKKQDAEARTSLSAAISEIRSSAAIEPEYRRRVVEQLKEVEARFDEVRKYERDARLSLELMSMMGVMAGFMTHEFEKAMDVLSQAAESLTALQIIDPELKRAAGDIVAHEKALANYLDYMRLFIDRARDPVAQNFKSFAQVSRASKTLSPIAESHKISTTIDIDPKLPGPHMPIAAYNGIVINLISNAVKALVPKIASEKRKIRLYATNDASNHVLVCADNGVGIPAFMRTRIWDPLFSTTKSSNDVDNPMASGLGLGLSVVQEVVKKMGGRIELLDAAPPGFVTAFKVTLPLSLTER